MNEIYTEKEILGDALNTEKNATNLYNLGANECVHDNLRETMLNLLSKEHEIQVDVFNQMHTMGFYPTPAAESKKVQEAKTKFECGYKAGITGRLHSSCPRVRFQSHTLASPLRMQ